MKNEAVRKKGKGIGERKKVERKKGERKKGERKTKKMKREGVIFLLIYSTLLLIIVY